MGQDKPNVNLPTHAADEECPSSDTPSLVQELGEEGRKGLHIKFLTLNELAQRWKDRYWRLTDISSKDIIQTMGEKKLPPYYLVKMAHGDDGVTFDIVAKGAGSSLIRDGDEVELVYALDTILAFEDENVNAVTSYDVIDKALAISRLYLTNEYVHHDSCIDKLKEKLSKINNDYLKLEKIISEQEDTIKKLQTELEEAKHNQVWADVNKHGLAAYIINRREELEKEIVQANTNGLATSKQSENVKESADKIMTEVNRKIAEELYKNPFSQAQLGALLCLKAPPEEITADAIKKSGERLVSPQLKKNNAKACPSSKKS